MTRLNFTLSNEQNIISINESDLEAKGIKMLDYLFNNKKIIESSKLNSVDLKRFIFNIDAVICDNKRIQELNSSYRAKNEPTDVLTFALFTDNNDNQVFGDEIILGEIIISSEMVQKQAEQSNKSFEKELLFLLAHGFLHLLGFEHNDTESFEYMVKIQNELVCLV